MKLSILIPTMLHREPTRNHLIWQIEHCFGGFRKGIDYEIILGFGRESVGEKRNILLAAATGEYSIFIDDDDEITPDYLYRIFEGIQKGVDHIGIAMTYAPDNGPSKLVLCSKDNKWCETPTAYLRGVQHVCAIKTEIARSVKYPDISFGEDKIYSELITPLVKTEHLITTPIYIYKYRSNK